ncbi:hypothetical protein GCM10022403_022880 [Streptomyces coacervatus]|uniref:Secreted protein n=1 Tax=Streptomyces coacervatus TaxID=647381 RepID=A0ABP7HAP5_9ACTN|nr:hypothetical protein [Streptomyces coacervatus]MDF2267754.1 hypothetical protein [Streptomyces coacervatus]
MALCAVLAVLDLAGIVGLWQHPGPPPGVVTTGTLLGGVTLGASRPASRDNIRALRVVVGSRVISALLGRSASKVKRQVESLFPIPQFVPHAY